MRCRPRPRARRAPSRRTTRRPPRRPRRSRSGCARSQAKWRKPSPQSCAVSPPVAQVDARHRARPRRRTSRPRPARCRATRPSRSPGRRADRRRSFLLLAREQDARARVPVEIDLASQLERGSTSRCDLGFDRLVEARRRRSGRCSQTRGTRGHGRFRAAPPRHRRTGRRAGRPRGARRARRDPLQRSRLPERRSPCPPRRTRRVWPACGHATSTGSTFASPTKRAANGEDGRAVDLVGRAHLLDPALVEDDDAVGERQRLALVVGDVDERRAGLAVRRGAARPPSRAGSSGRARRAARRAAGRGGGSRARARARSRCICPPESSCARRCS